MKWFKNEAMTVLLLSLFLLPSCGGNGSEEEDTGAAVQDVVAEDEGGGGVDLTVEELPEPEVDVKEPEEDVCAPSCEGKECGTDGCGGSCGTCMDYTGAEDGELCLADGTCEESVDPNLEPDDLTGVSGVVLDGDGNPVTGLFVQPCTYSDDAEKCHKATTKADGSFSLSFAPAIKVNALHVRFVTDDFTPSACHWEFEELPFANNEVVFEQPFVIEAMGEPDATVDIGSEGADVSADGMSFSIGADDWFPGIFEPTSVRVHKLDLDAHLPCFVPEDNVPDGLYALTPDWLSFSTPGGLEVSFENSKGLGAGATVDLYVLGGLDTKIRPLEGEPVHLHTGDYYKFGTGTVSADGNEIVSDPGMGLPAMGWMGWKAQ